MNLQQASILITGATGFVGRNLVEMLRTRGVQPITPSHAEFDLNEQDQVRRLLAQTRPDLVFHLAGLTGGIGASSTLPADFNYRNLLMGTMMLHESWQAGVKKYITLIGGCSYPAHAPSPIRETELFNGYPQAESASFSLAKAMSQVQAEAYRRQYGFNGVVLVPGNLYGPHDNFDLQSSHVIPALIRKFIAAKDSGAREVVAWGSGRPVRDFMFVRDACEAILIAAETYDSSDLINISSGQPTSIRELTDTIAGLVGFQGRVAWDTSRPDGQMLKVYDITRMKKVLGYECRTPLREGLMQSVAWFAKNQSAARLRR